jgi:hypothetical protein
MLLPLLWRLGCGLSHDVATKDDIPPLLKRSRILVGGGVAIVISVEIVGSFYSNSDPSRMSHVIRQLHTLSFISRFIYQTQHNTRCNHRRTSPKPLHSFPSFPQNCRKQSGLAQSTGNLTSSLALPFPNSRSVVKHEKCF